RENPGPRGTFTVSQACKPPEMAGIEGKTRAPSLHVDRLDVDELTDAEARQLAAVAGFFHSAEGQARVRGHQRVHEDVAGLDSGGHPLAPRRVRREDGRSQA